MPTTDPRKFSRRDFVVSGGAALAGGSSLILAGMANAAGSLPTRAGENSSTTGGSYTPVVTPNGSTMPWVWKDGAKEFHIVAEPVRQEFGKGMVVDCWGYNGQAPGPTIETVEGDRVRFFVTNKLEVPTSMHWHGVLLPNGMDGVAGLTQKSIQPGETYVYEFTLRQHGTQMYHPHSDEMEQMGRGMMGFFIIHPKQAPTPKVDRDFAIFLAEWFIAPGESTPDPTVMTEFNNFTFNGRAFPGTDPLVAKLGDRTRVRFANLSMDNHPLHLHGHKFFITGTDGGPIAASAQFPHTTADIPPGTTRDLEFVADNPGDWAFHCHKTHHTMNSMAHGEPGSGAKQDDMAGMDMSNMKGMDMSSMKQAKNTLPMMGGDGPYGSIGMGGMFTILKVRENLASYADPGWYSAPAGTQARKV
jgi:FtsP/CotA-like multicopper oxidase with cupredoxin domain